MLKRVLFALLLLAFFPAMTSMAGEEASDAKEHQLPVPRFVTLATDEINLRTGPGLRYPIRLVITRAGLPVEVIREFDIWREIRDMDGDEGWVHKSMLSGRRAVIIKGSMRTLVKKADDARPVARLEPGVVAELKTCRAAWCDLTVGGYEGWLKRDSVWGVYPDEKFMK